MKTRKLTVEVSEEQFYAIQHVAGEHRATVGELVGALALDWLQGERPDCGVLAVASALLMAGDESAPDIRPYLITERAA